MTTMPPATAEPSAALSGTFAIDGVLPVVRLGFGAMRITGKGIWGDPADPAEARRVLKRVPELGINLIDTADSYGPEVSERLIREVLYPYDGLVIATKGGLTRPGPSQWVSNGRPEYLRRCVEASLKRLGVEQIALWQLHALDSKVPRADQFGAVQALYQGGKIAHVGLSNVSVDDIKAAQRLFPVGTVQNRYNLADRAHEDVLTYCEGQGIGFIPFFPLAAGDLAREGSQLAAVAERHEATPGQIALAWLLARSPVMLPIPGTSKVSHLEENVRAAAIQLSPEDLRTLNAAAA